MNRLTISILIFSLSQSWLHAQVLVQDAQGKTSIMYHGNAVNFDILQARASFSYNSFSNERYKNKDRKFFWGTRVSASSKNGVSGIINQGNIVPEGEFSITLGITKNYGENNENIQYITAVKKLERDVRKNGKIKEAFQKQLEDFGKIDPDIAANAALQASIDGLISGEPYELLVQKIRALGAANAALNGNITILANSIEKQIEDFNRETQFTRKEINVQWDQIERSWWKNRGLIYAIFGGTGSEFVHQQNPSSLIYDERFKKVNFQGLKAGVGYNYQLGASHIFGGNIIIQKSNTFSGLDSEEFTFTNSTALSSGKIDVQDVFVAYSGKYDTYTELPINVDYATFITGFSDEKSVLSLNAYTRHKISFNPSIFPTTTNIGGGAYFFKNDGAFLGGIYFELADLANNIEKRQENPILKPFYNRLSVGITTKFTLNSIIAYLP
ncbi:hypothetical protein SAMN04487996_122163 [Dyadobacter soli]|uniref:Uncharacterized protein n=2 Tax=Dyadobacter soli TaxID=659014 RepID=A0A1G7WTP4_9BACT|nr:hypothetical protein SAMN04487996_122163 [Dyadobacter soli]